MLQRVEEELDDAFNSINPLDLENTRDRHDKAKAALKEYNDRVFPKENRLGKDDGSNDSAIEELNNSLSSELQDAKEQMDFGWSIMQTYLENYKEYQKGKTLSVYNSPNVVELVL